MMGDMNKHLRFNPKTLRYVLFVIASIALVLISINGYMYLIERGEF